MTGPGATPGRPVPAVSHQRRGGRVDALVGDVRVAWWLKTRDLAGRTDRSWLLPTLAAGYVTCTLLLLAGALLVHAHSPITGLDLGALLVPLWLLWTVLPALGGGGDVEAAARLAHYPVPARVQLFSTWLSAHLDLQYLVPLPGVLATVAAAYGPAALVPIGVFVLGSSAAGQLVGWAATGGLQRAGRRRSSALIGSAVAVAVLAAAAVATRAGVPVVALFDALPPGWMAVAAHGPATGGLPGWGAYIAGCVALAAPVAALLVCGPALVARVERVRADGRAAAARRHRPLPGGAVRALTVVVVRSIIRSVAGRAAALSALAVPFLAVVAFPQVTVVALGALTLLSAGATVAVNVWAYTDGGTTLTLAAPLPRTSVLAAQVAGTVVYLTGILVAVIAVALALGIPAGAGPLELAGFTGLGVLVHAAVGVRTATARPTAVDLDSLRAKPAPLPSAVSYTVRGGLHTGAARVVNCPRERRWPVRLQGGWHVRCQASLSGLQGRCAQDFATAGDGRSGTQLGRSCRSVTRCPCGARLEVSDHTRAGSPEGL